MQKILEQKQRTNLRKFTLLSDKVLVETKSLRKNEKYEVMFENLGNRLSYQSDSTVLGKVFFYICLAIPIALTIAVFAGSNIESSTLILNYIIWFGFAIVNFLKKSQDDVFLVGGNQILVFYRTIPNEKEVSNFIDGIILASNNYMREKYFKVDTDIPSDMFFARLTWLKDKDIITESEYLEIKNEYELKKLL